MPTKLLAEAFERVSALPEPDQDRIAARLLAEFESDDAQWDETLSSPDSLRFLADMRREVLAAHAHGATEAGGFDGR